jgi:ABC-type multidrug transport system fused ATPase/permease subunit
MRLKRVPHALKHTLRNLKKMLVLAWRMDAKLTFFYYFTAALGALTPLATSLVFRKFLDQLIKFQGFSKTEQVPLILIFVLALRYIINIAHDIINWSLNRVYADYLFRYKLQNELSLIFSQKLAYLDIPHLENAKVQTLIEKVRDTIHWRPTDFLRTFSYLFANVIGYLSVYFVLAQFGWWIPFLVTLTALPRLYLRTKFGQIHWSIYGSGAPQAKKLWYLGYLLTDNAAIREMRIFQSQKILLDKFKKIQNYLYSINKKPIEDYVRLLSFTPLFEALVLFLVGCFFLPRTLSGLMTVGTFTLLINMIDQLNSNAVGFVLNLGEIYENNLYVDHFFEVLELPKAIKEHKRAKVFKRIIPPLIEFRHVSFAYPNGPQILKNISFTIKPKEHLAIVGPNGAGKTTLIKLLCRFYDVSEGKILVNGVNLKRLKLENWYQFLGTLFQDFVHYHFTARENITLGGSFGKADKRSILEAAKKSGAYEFIQSLPKGFNQVLGREFEQGQEVSIGQWQKLAIARAFYEKAPVLILDEPTSAIDAQAEYEIFENLQRVYKNKTLILVSHRFSTVRQADKIIVLKEGQIVESGSHQQLMAKKGMYAELFELQAKSYR